VLLLRMLLQSLVFAVVLGLFLFLPAGTLDWPEAWVFMAIFIGCSEATGLWLARSDPALLAARMRSPLSRDQRPRDRAVAAAIFLAFFLWLAFMPLDAKRFGWSSVPLSAEALGAVLVLGAFYGWVGVLRANSFAATNVRLQQERGQTVISTGPYAVVRHPMYAYVLLLLVGAPLLLGSLWGLLVGLVLVLPLLAARTLGEEALLMDGLPGYRDYAARVRYRILPGVW
jgi:protein-S-isoprenylcysteine O-methyltransferase Ste14